MKLKLFGLWANAPRYGILPCHILPWSIVNHESSSSGMASSFLERILSWRSAHKNEVHTCENSDLASPVDDHSGQQTMVVTIKIAAHLRKGSAEQGQLSMSALSPSMTKLSSVSATSSKRARFQQHFENQLGPPTCNSSSLTFCVQDLLAKESSGKQQSKWIEGLKTFSCQTSLVLVPTCCL